MERPPYNNLCGQNRVQILLSDSRETPLFSLGKNTHTKKNKEFEHNRFRTVLLRRVVHRRRHSNRTPGLAVKLPSSTQNVGFDFGFIVDERELSHSFSLSLSGILLLLFLMLFSMETEKECRAFDLYVCCSRDSSAGARVVSVCETNAFLSRISILFYAVF